MISCVREGAGEGCVRGGMLQVLGSGGKGRYGRKVEMQNDKMLFYDSFLMTRSCVHATASHERLIHDTERCAYVSGSESP